MAPFADGIVVKRAFDDFDALVAAAGGWKLEAARLDAGRFAAQFEMAATSDMQLLRARSDTGLVIAGETPAGAAGVGLILSGPGGIRSLGRSIDPMRTAPARLRRSALHFLSNGPFDIMVATFDEALLERHLWNRIRKEATSLGQDWLVRTAAGTPSCPDRGHAIAGLLGVLSGGGVTTPAAKHRLRECVLQILLDGLETDPTSAPAASRAGRRRVARAAEEVLRARLDDPPSLSELCGVLNVPERTLNAAFHDGFGMAPKAYLRALRLSAVYTRLRLARSSVTEAATELGFFHFGRFSGEYRAMFGEAPSETLRRARAMGHG